MNSEHAGKESEHLTKVSIQLKEPGYERETLWAEPIAEGSYRLRNVPFLAYGYSEQDVVRATPIDGWLVVSGVAERGGHSTYRLYFPEALSDEEFQPIWQPLAHLGCTYERANSRLIGIDVPPSSDVYAVYGVLEEGEAAQLWKFEEGYCGHPLRT